VDALQAGLLAAALLVSAFVTLGVAARHYSRR
jgi:hypothetical protein